MEYFVIIQYFYYLWSDTVLFESGIGLVGNVYLANAMATIKKCFVFFFKFTDTLTNKRKWNHVKCQLRHRRSMKDKNRNKEQQTESSMVVINPTISIILLKHQ